MRSKQYDFTVVVIIALLGMVGCKQDDPLTEEQKQIDLLTGTWMPATGSSISVDKEDVSINFKDMHIMLNPDKTYVSTNGNSPVWPESGSYDFEMINGQKNLNKLIRDDGVIITIENLTENSWRFNFLYIPTNSGGRSKAVQGEYEFNLVSE